MPKLTYPVLAFSILIALSACAPVPDDSALLRSLPDGSTYRLRPAAPAIGDRVHVVLDVPLQALPVSALPVLQGPDGERLSPIQEEAIPGGRRYFWSFRPYRPGNWVLLTGGLREDICTLASALMTPADASPGPVLHDTAWLWSGEGDRRPRLGQPARGAVNGNSGAGGIP